MKKATYFLLIVTCFATLTTAAFAMGAAPSHDNGNDNGGSPEQQQERTQRDTLSPSQYTHDQGGEDVSKSISNDVNNTLSGN
jgi:hypothetical protein